MYQIEASESMQEIGTEFELGGLKSRRLIDCTAVQEVTFQFAEIRKKREGNSAQERRWRESRLAEVRKREGKSMRKEPDKQRVWVNRRAPACVEAGRPGEHSSSRRLDRTSFVHEEHLESPSMRATSRTVANYGAATIENCETTIKKLKADVGTFAQQTCLLQEKCKGLSTW